MKLLDLLRLDFSWNRIYTVEEPLNCNNFKLIFIILCSLKSETFHSVILVRLFIFFSSKKYLRFFRRYFSYRLKRRYSILVYDDLSIGGGLRLPHPYGIILGRGTVLGEMVTVGQYVTLGGNMGLIKNNRSTPMVGSWSMICANSVIAGPINIREDVIIGACSFVNKDIPKHSIVTTQGAINVKYKDGKYSDSIVRNQYFNFSPTIIQNFTLKK